MIYRLLPAYRCARRSRPGHRPCRSREQMQMSFSPVVKQVAPAVVNIYTRRVVPQMSRRCWPIRSSASSSGEPHGMPQDRVQRSLGSGVHRARRRHDRHQPSRHQEPRRSPWCWPTAANSRRPCCGTDERTDLAVLKIDTGEREAADPDHWATPTPSRSAIWCWPSAIPSASARP